MSFKSIFSFLALSLVILAPSLASASVFEQDLCNIVLCYLTGPVVLVLATIAIFFLGIGAFFGKVNWGLAITVGIGIIIIVGAPEIAELFSTGDNCIDPDYASNNGNPGCQ